MLKRITIMALAVILILSGCSEQASLPDDLSFDTEKNIFVSLDENIDVVNALNDSLKVFVEESQLDFSEKDTINDYKNQIDKFAKQNLKRFRNMIPGETKERFMFCASLGYLTARSLPDVGYKCINNSDETSFFEVAMDAGFWTCYWNMRCDGESFSLNHPFVSIKEKQGLYDKAGIIDQIEANMFVAEKIYELQEEIETNKDPSKFIHSIRIDIESGLSPKMFDEMNKAEGLIWRFSKSGGTTFQNIGEICTYTSYTLEYVLNNFDGEYILGTILDVVDTFFYGSIVGGWGLSSFDSLNQYYDIVQDEASPRIVGENFDLNEYDEFEINLSQNKKEEQITNFLNNPWAGTFCEKKGLLNKYS